MAESVHWQVVEAIRTRLAAIRGDGGSTYWYTPSRVIRTQIWDRFLADSSLEHILALRAQEETYTEKSTGAPSTGGVVGATAELTLLMLRRHEAATVNPFDEESPTRELVVDRMVRDVVRALFGGDVTLGGIAINVVSGSFVVDRDVAVEGAWAVAEARFAVEYDYLALTP